MSARSRFRIGHVSGGDSIGSTSADGGAGGNTKVNQSPKARSGDSGTTTVQSSGSNTGNTGAASSTSIADPVSTTGNSGNTGPSGKGTQSNSTGDSAWPAPAARP